MKADKSTMISRAADPVETGMPTYTLKEQVDMSCIQYLYENSRSAIFVNTSLAILAAIVIWLEAGTTDVAFWLAANIIANGFRFLIVLRYPKESGDSEEYLKWALFFTIGVAISGMTWGYAAFAFSDPNVPVLDVFMLMCVLGISTGAAPSLHPHFKAYVAFSLPIILPLIANFAMRGGVANTTLAVMGLLFFAMLLLTARKSNQTLRIALEERFRNEALAHAIEHARHEAEKARREAENANKAKSEFLSSMSHELRTPLNAILGFGQMLEYNPKEPLTVDQKDSVNQIMKGGHHLLELINDVLDLAKIESGDVDISIEDVPVKPVLDECLSLMQTMAEERGIKFFVGDGFEAGVGIRADEIRFKQCLLNLMSNAVKYNRENGSITLDCHETTGAMLHISVADTGNGIPEDLYDALFQPFNRLDAENTEIEGTGIGLTITQRLIERMDGRIGVDSEVGKGSTFWIELPRVEAKLFETVALAEGGSDDEAKSLPGIDGTILYVEDNPANLKLMEMIINRVEGLSMISAYNAELGIELAKKEKPDIIILDINLPGMNGYEALAKLQTLKETKGTPVIALSANAMPKNIEKGIDAGFVRYLTKPINVEEVVAVIKDLIEN